MPTSDKLPRPVSMHLARPPANDAELWAYVKAVWGVKIPRVSVCTDKGHVSPFEAFASAYFSRTPITVWKSSRGYGGKSYALATLALTIAVTRSTEVYVLGGSGAQSQRVLEAMNELWSAPSAPSELLIGDPTKNEHRLKNGGHVVAVPASQKSVRGIHPSYLLIDEADELDLPILDAAMPTVMDDKKNGVRAHTVISSTHQYCLAGDTLVTTVQGEVPISQITPGTQVLTRAGWKKVLRLWNNGSRETITLRLSNGRSITCTPDHLFACGDSWLPAISLTTPLVVAGPTSPSSLVVGLDDKWASTTRAAFLAMVLGSQSFASQDVSTVVDRLQMAGINASSNPTEMVQRRFSRPNPNLVRSTMRQGPNSVTVTEAIQFQLPDPAFGCVSHVLLLDTTQDEFFIDNRFDGPRSTLLAEARPRLTGVVGHRRPADFTDSVHVFDIVPSGMTDVYDLEVEDVHEFVAEGVVVHNSDGTFSEVKKRANDKGWQTCEWCLYESMEPYGWLTAEEVERQKSRVSEQTWAVEVLGQEPNSEGRAIVPESVDDMFIADSDPRRAELWPLLKLTNIKGAPNYYLECEGPIEGARYSTGVDWAKQNDSTVVATFRIDIEPIKLVAFERMNRRPWPQMVKKVDERLDRYGGACSHDGTGKGDVVADLLVHNAEDFIFTERSRSDLLTTYISAVEQGRVIAPRINWAYNEHKYLTNDVIYGNKKDDGDGSKGHLPDSVAAFALAWRARNQKYKAKVYTLGRGRGR